MTTVVLAYTGGLKTTAAIAWLAERHHARVVTVSLDLGQSQALDDVRERALAAGAVRAHVVDAREEFAREFVLRSLHAGAVRDGQVPLVAALARPLVARHLVAVARLEGARIVAHGCEDEIDQIRIEAAIASLDPALTVIAPVQEWDMTPADLAGYARTRGIPVTRLDTASRRVDANLWGRAIAAGPLQEAADADDDLYVLTEPPGHAPDQAAHVEITFERGVPLAINGVAMPLTELIASLETIAGSHGVGRVELVDGADRTARAVVEAPAAVVLHAAHRALEQAVTPADLERLAVDLSGQYVDLVERGLWFTPTREASDALVAKVQERVTGRVTVKLFKGQFQVIGSQSPFASMPQPRRAGRMAAMGRK